MIFYFSATGNSLYAAQKLADAEHTACISIADVMRAKAAKTQYQFAATDEEAVGFVLPTYFCGLPSIVPEFLSKLRVDGASGRYIFLVMTYGAMDGNAAAQFQKELVRQGVSLSAAYSICTVDSYLPMFSIPEKGEMDTILAKAKGQLEQICAAVQRRERNERYASHGLGAVLSTAIMYPAYCNGRKTVKFTVGDSCTGCGLCESSCPCGAIRLENGRPAWVKSECIFCLGCLHRCPAAAIDYGKKTTGKKRYMNPHITLPDKFL